MGCCASKVEIANDDSSIRTTFFHILNNNMQNLDVLKEIEEEENLRYSEDSIYWVIKENKSEILNRNQLFSSKILDSEKVLYNS